MEQQTWEKGIQHIIKPVESLIQELLADHYLLDVSEADLGDQDSALRLLQKGHIAAAFHEDNFNMEGCITFEGDWYAELAKAILGIEAVSKSEISEDLVKDFFAKLVDAVYSYLKGTFNVGIGISNVQYLRRHQIKTNLNPDSYYTVRLDIVSSKPNVVPELSLLLALTLPDEQVLQQIAGVIAAEEIENPQTVEQKNEATEDEGFGNHADGDNIVEKEQDFKKKITKKVIKKDMSNEGEQIMGQKVEFEEFSKEGATVNEEEIRNIEMLRDVELDLSVELGRKEISFGEILKLMKGSVIELEKLAGEPVEILINGFPIAQGEVIVIDEHFGVRVSKLVPRKERLKSLV